jgi:hypothetical protein
MMPPRGGGEAAAAPRPDTTAVLPARGWIQSPGYDLLLFTLSPVAGLLVIWADLRLPGGAYVVAAATYLVAIPHYMSSFTFYLGDENLAHYRTRWVAFFVGPALIIAGVVGLRLLGVHRPVQSTLFVWNVWHVALQSAGILSIYRRLNGGDPRERPAAHLTILAANATMAFWAVDRYPPLYELLHAVHPLAPWVLRGAALPVAAGAFGVLVYRLAKRSRPVSVAELAFLTTSLLLFHPYLWVQDANLATFGMLMGHFIQYLAIVWLLNRRKYAGAGGSTRQRVLGLVSGRGTLLIGVIVGTGVAFYLANEVTVALGIPMAYVIAWNALTLVHFYVDGLVWAFRRPFVRTSVGPYLMPSSRLESR